MANVVLDISRSISRAPGKRHTGIDRVERAYIRHFLQSRDDAVFIARFRRQCAIFERDAVQALLERLEGRTPWDAVDIRGRLSRRDEGTNRVEATLRRLANSRHFCYRTLKHRFPRGFTYVNVGHSKLRPTLWPRLRQAGAGRIVVLVHDMIPLDYPQFCLPTITTRFAKEMQAAATNADVLLCNSQTTADSVQQWLEVWGVRRPAIHVVHLGTDALAQPLSAQTTVEHPYFVALGTIEPRKNHRLLLDIWQDFHANLPKADVPHLYIVGERGWMNAEVFATLDQGKFVGKTVFETGRLPDADVADLLHGARALLFPSFAEGFGYPVIEAMLAGIPVICADLPSVKEVAGDYPVYVDVAEPTLWREQILAHTRSGRRETTFLPIFPTWAQHFHKFATILADD